MKLKSGFMLHCVGDENVVVPVGERTKTFHGMIRLNRSGAFLWENMKDEFTAESLTQALLDRYEVEEAVAAATVNKFLATLEQHELIEK